MIEETKRKDKSIILIVLLLSAIFHLLLILGIFKYKYESKPNLFIKKEKPSLIKCKSVDVQKKDNPKKDNHLIKKEEKKKMGSIFNEFELPSIKAKKGISSFSMEDDSKQEGIHNEGESSNLIAKEVANESKKSTEIKTENKAGNSKVVLQDQISKNTALEQHNLNNNNNANEARMTSEGNALIGKKPKRKILSYSNRPTVPKKFMQGILEGHIDGQEGQLFNVIGDSKSTSDLKYLNYINKILMCMHNSWNIKQHKIKITKNVSTYFGIALVIGKNGEIVSLEKTRSTGIIELDDILMETMNYAAPYPPIPQHFNKETFTFDKIFSIGLSLYGEPWRRF